jgi:hypothetical protein
VYVCVLWFVLQMRKVLKAGGCVSSSKRMAAGSSSSASMAAVAKPSGGDDEEEWATVSLVFVWVEGGGAWQDKCCICGLSGTMTMSHGPCPVLSTRVLFWIALD